MALCKEVCKVCLGRRDRLFVGGTSGWTRADDHAWEVARLVQCPSAYMDAMDLNALQEGTSVEGQPPSWCPYTVEHVVNEIADKEASP